ncbi:MAG: diguanylate cyclase [Lachnospiraceae bacterium]|nr:diguanylate cyclase [Lachnospiraceae bacterium]
MRSLKEIISRYMKLITCVMVVIILIIITYVQITNEQRQAYESAVRTFQQIEQLLEENQEELEEIRKEYSETCLHNAEAIAYIIQSEPSVLESVEELKSIAQFIEVDEIHIFDDTGRIYAGTHPEYYDFTFESGEQMMFFKPMLDDKSLKLVQEITPNTAEAKMMQYSALWSNNGEFIVQVGMEPVNVMKATQKNELSYLFSLLRVSPDAQYYAIDIESGKIVGSTELECVGKDLTEVGLKQEQLIDCNKGFHAVINGRDSYCVFEKVGTGYIGRVISSKELYRRVLWTTITLAIGLIVIAAILAHAVIRYMNKYVVDGIYGVNAKLHRIAQGDLDELIDIQSSAEFSELSSYINIMKNSLLDNNKKMSYVLGKTNMYIGVYEYNEYMKRVRFTEYIPRILLLDEKETKRLSADYKSFKAFIDKLRENPVSNETGIFEIDKHYVKIEEIADNNGVFGVVIDMTDEVIKRKKIEGERDIDLLTGLYNRRGMEIKLDGLFGGTEEIENGALVMIDADNLKVINDTYGHEVGDIYLMKISELIAGLDADRSVAGRWGGDEFVLFLYRYDDEKELIDTLNSLESIQENSETSLGDDVRVSLRFSFGYSLIGERTDYQNLLKEADEKMYENKRKRKEKG